MICEVMCWGCSTVFEVDPRWNAADPESRLCVNCRELRKILGEEPAKVETAKPAGWLSKLKAWILRRG